MFIPIRRIGCLFVTMSTDLFSFLRFNIQTINNVQHSIAWYGVVPSLGATLGIEGTTYSG